MAKQRNHSKTYRQRNEKARREGFASYNEKRKVLRTVNEESGTNDLFREHYEEPVIGSSDAEDLHMARTFYRAFYGKEKNNYSTSGPKAAWFVGVAGLMTFDEWAARYPLGVREYAPVAA